MPDEYTFHSKSGVGYRRTGSGTPLLLLHGIPGAAQSWQRVVEALHGNLDVIVPDLLGFGGSARPDQLAALHAAGQSEALNILLADLDISGVVVVGHDFGGPVAIELVRRRPAGVTGLGLLATNAFPDTPIPFPLSLVNVPLVGGIARKALFSRPSLLMMLRRGVGRGSPRPDSATSLGDRRQQAAIATIFAGSLAQLQDLYQPIADQLRQVDVPVFVGWGTHDPFFPIGQGARLAATTGSALRVYDGAGHFLPEERADEVAADILGLAGLCGPKVSATPAGSLS